MRLCEKLHLFLHTREMHCPISGKVFATKLHGNPDNFAIEIIKAI